MTTNAEPTTGDGEFSLGGLLRQGIVVELRRHLALHGTASGWNTRDNAVRAVLLLAAAARVAEPLLAPRSP